jgi:predicted patatin/cPLA2 family phospholipase
LTPSPFAPVSDDQDRARRSLVLAGGGMRVAYQAGVLAALEQAGISFHHADGASGGTLNLSMLLSGQSSAEMCERWRTLDPRHFSAPLRLAGYIRSPHWPGLGSGRGIREKVFPHLGVDPEVIRRAEWISGTYNVCNFADKTAEVVEHTDVDMDLLVAAVSLPVLMPAVIRRGIPYTDAVWIRDSNVAEAVRRGSDEIWLVWCIGNSPVYHDGSFRQYVHMIEMAANGSLLRDLAFIEAGFPDRDVRIHVIKPRHPLPLDPDYFLGRIDAATLIDLGYQDACQYLDRPQPCRAPWRTAPTGMTESAPGATVRLGLDGPFALGETSLDLGALEGQRPGHAVSIRIQLQARGCSSEVMTVAGDISLPRQEPRILIEQGTARFVERGGLRIELAWREGRSPRSLTLEPAGDASLSVTLHDGGSDGPVMGVGTVTMSWRQLGRALASVHATDQSSAAAATRARAALARGVLRAGRARRARAPVT